MSSRTPLNSFITPLNSFMSSCTPLNSFIIPLNSFMSSCTPLNSFIIPLNSFMSSRTNILSLVNKMRMMCYSVMTQAYSEKEIPSSPNRSRTYDLPITSSDALPLSHRRLVLRPLNLVHGTNILHTARICMSKSGIRAMIGNVMEYFKPGE